MDARLDARLDGVFASSRVRLRRVRLQGALDWTIRVCRPSSSGRRVVARAADSRRVLHIFPRLGAKAARPALFTAAHAFR
jgi:hypothetical protein